MPKIEGAVESRKCKAAAVSVTTSSKEQQEPQPQYDEEDRYSSVGSQDSDPDIESDPDLEEDAEEGSVEREPSGDVDGDANEEDDDENYNESESESDGNDDEGEANQTEHYQQHSNANETLPETQGGEPANTSAATAGKKNRKRRNSAPSSDEERWLTAIESGKLEEVDDELKKIKDPKLMTARQRAMYERTGDPMTDPTLVSEELQALPSGYREREKPTTAEQIQKAALKVQKRKQQADERREKDKKKTMERLLKKQDSNKRQGNRSKNSKYQQPMISYRDTGSLVFVQIPEGYEFPLQAKIAVDPPKKQMCGMEGCNQQKAYNCAKTNVPLCSLACYRKNLRNWQQSTKT